MDSLTELFCVMDDDFCKRIEPALNKHLLEENKRKCQRHPGLSLSELMTLVVLFHQIRYRRFKFFICIIYATICVGSFPGCRLVNDILR